MEKTVNTENPLVKFIAEKPYGEIIHYQDIERITGKRRKTGSYYNVISKAKRLLEELGKAITPAGGGDYVILYPGDYTAAYARDVRLAKRRIDHGGHLLDGAPTKDMSTEELNCYNRVTDFHRRMDASIRGSTVEVKRLADAHPLRATQDGKNDWRKT